MSSEARTTPRRPHLARLRRVAAGAGALVVGAIVLSGCVAIQSESATQSNVIGNSVTISTTICGTTATAAAPCNSPGNSNQYAVSAPNTSASGQLLVGYRIPAGVTAPPSISASVPSVDENGNPILVPFTLNVDPGYTAGLAAIAPPPAGTQWVGYVSVVSDQAIFKAGGPQAATIAPTFGLPAGFVGPFTWRTVVGYWPTGLQGQAVSCPAPFPGTTPSHIPGQSGVCIDYPDLGTIQGAPSSLATGDLEITPPGTPSVSAGSKLSMAFVGVFNGGNPQAGVFTASVATTVPGVTPNVAPVNFAPGSNSQTPLTVAFTVPAATPPGSYTVTVTATVAGQARAATGHITVTASKASAASSKNAAKLTSKLKATTLKVARSTGVALTLTLSRKSAVSLVGLQSKPKVSVTVKKTLKAGKKTVVLVKSKKFHKGKLTITFKGGGLTKVFSMTLH